MLKVNNLTKLYGEYYAVKDLSFSIYKSGVFALLGTNGAGKTTTIRMMLDMLSKDNGTVLWNDKPLNPMSVSVGYLAEERGLYQKYNILDQLVYFAALRGVKRAAAIERINSWFARLGIDEHKNKNADQLSKGNQQKVQLIAALVSDPELLILDEPMSGLDPVNAELFRKIIFELVEAGKFIIMSSHQMSTVEDFCDNLVILHRGNTILSGNLNDIKKNIGRSKLSVKCENVNILKYSGDIKVINHTPAQTDFEISSEEQAEKLLSCLIDDGVKVIKYEIREPTLNEIFVDAVAKERGNER
jgi:ABC-2 type transport system ATP-binding protein